jgi:heptosyltransferase-3
VLEDLPFIDTLGVIDKGRAFWKGRLVPARYEAAVVFGREPALVDYALRVSRRVVAYDEPEFPQDARLVRVPVREGVHAVLDRVRLLEPLGISNADPRLAYQVSGGERSAARALITSRWPRSPRPVIALQMSSFPTKAHRDWPVASFAALADRLVEEWAEARFILLGDAHARSVSEPFIQRHAERTLIAAGRTRLRESAALIAESDLYVGVDTGPTHIAGALGVRMVAMYHCLYPGRLLGPLEQPLCRIIEHPLVGSPNCGMASMDAIPVDRVHRAARELLATVPALEAVP